MLTPPFHRPTYLRRAAAWALGLTALLAQTLRVELPAETRW